jgi:hypothetical protein
MAAGSCRGPAVIACEALLLRGLSHAFASHIRELDAKAHHARLGTHRLMPYHIALLAACSFNIAAAFD